jgi:hypothetical protein
MTRVRSGPRPRSTLENIDTGVVSSTSHTRTQSTSSNGTALEKTRSASTSSVNSNTDGPGSTNEQQQISPPSTYRTNTSGREVSIQTEIENSAI